MDLPQTENPTPTPNQPSASPKNPVKPPSSNIFNHYLDLKKTSSKIILAGIIFFLVFLILMVLLKLLSPAKKTPDSSSKTSVATESPKPATESAITLTPQAELEAIYEDVVGSEDVKKSLMVSSSGVAVVEYTIPSADGQTIIKTSYENFADFAIRAFNIDTVTALNVTTYANRFTDKFGQPDQPALKLQITKATNDKINWPLKKFVYKDYAGILDFHELNSLLQKDYEKLLKATTSN